jgi:hypothetical protein
VVVQENEIGTDRPGRWSPRLHRSWQDLMTRRNK